MIVASGVTGTIKWGEAPGWYTAAGIHGYTVAYTDGQWTLTANVVLENAYNLAQRPLWFVTAFGKGQMRWPIASMTLDKDTKALTAQLGPPQES